MKILIYGAGVIGCTYGWQLANAGCEVTLLVKEEKMQGLKKSGILIHCSDYRGRKKQESEVIFHPEVIEKLPADNDFDYIIISVGSADLISVLPTLSKSAGKAHVVFFLNIWNDFDAIAKYLPSEQYSFGFPFMAGGGRDGDVINAVVSGSKYSKTMLGNADGNISPRLKTFADILEKADLRPFITPQIINWLVPHYVFIAALSAGVIESEGLMRDFLNNGELIKNTIRAIREGFKICEKRNIDPKKEKVNRLYYLPFFICIPIIRKIFSNEDMASMFNGYLRHAVRDIKYMLAEVIHSGETYNVKTPYLDILNEHIRKL